MKNLFYEKSADEKYYIYCINFENMAQVGYRFVGPHIHKSIELVVCYSGTLEYQINEEKGEIHKNDILIINSYDSHHYAYKGNAGAYLMVFSYDLIKDVFPDKGYEFNNVIHLSDNDMREVVKYIDEHYTKHEYYSPLQKKSMCLGLFGLLHNHDLFREKSFNSNRNIASKIMQYIETHYTENIDLDTISKHFGYNRNYFSSLFNKMIGTSFTSYLNDYRLEKFLSIKKSNENSNIALEELIFSCGFNSTETFYRTYRKYKIANAPKEVSYSKKEEVKEPFSGRKMKAVIVGLGNRGEVYADYALNEPEQMEIVGVVDPNPYKLQYAKDKYGLDDKSLFLSWDEFLKANVEADFVVNATMDQTHYETAIQILNAKYNMLQEKPIVPCKEQLLEIEQLAEKNDCQVFVCHVLRYTPFYRTIKKLINDGTVGDIISIEMNEHVCLPHYLTSYDRGKWNSEEACGSGFLLAKCCHDMDLICWLNNASYPEQVASFGHRAEFIPENKPTGATERCYNCPHDSTCPYSATRLYLRYDPMPFLTWDNLNKSLDSITKEEKEENLKVTNFGKCAYDCGGDIVDRQNMIISFKNHSLVTFTLASDTTKPDRYIHIVGNRGEIEGKIEENLITVREYNNDSLMGVTRTIDCTKQIVINVKFGGHSGGDYMIMHDMIAYLNGDKSSISITSIKDSINGHLLVYAAEESRKTGKIVKL